MGENPSFEVGTAEAIGLSVPFFLFPARGDVLRDYREEPDFTGALDFTGVLAGGGAAGRRAGSSAAPCQAAATLSGRRRVGKKAARRVTGCGAPASRTRSREVQ